MEFGLLDPALLLLFSRVFRAESAAVMPKGVAKRCPTSWRLSELDALRRLQISLYDFAVGLLNYCVDGKEHLSRLAFDVYDRHTTGTITEADLEGMLIDVWGPNW